MINRPRNKYIVVGSALAHISKRGCVIRYTVCGFTGTWDWAFRGVSLLRFVNQCILIMCIETSCRLLRDLSAYNTIWSVRLITYNAKPTTTSCLLMHEKSHKEWGQDERCLRMVTNFLVLCSVQNMGSIIRVKAILWHLTICYNQLKSRQNWRGALSNLLTDTWLAVIRKSRAHESF